MRWTKKFRSVALRASLCSIPLWVAAGCGGSTPDATPPTPVVPTPPTPAVTYSIGGSIAGLTGTLLLQNNGGEVLIATAGQLTFTFLLKIAGGSAYNVTVLTPPTSGQTCSVMNASGAVGSVDITNVAVTCGTAPATGSSFGLIDAARAAGAIDAETAFKYKVFAAYADPRLPVPFRGNDEGIFDVPEPSQLNGLFDSLSQAAQAELGPYLLRPTIAGSWADASKRLPSRDKARPNCQILQSSSWGVVDRVGIPVRVWWSTGDLATAEAMADEIQNTIWPAFQRLGVTMPPSDVNSGPSICYGTDGKLDVYIVRSLGTRGLTVAESQDLRVSPSHILLRRPGVDSAAVVNAAMAHELMHAVQYAHRTKSTQESYGWIRDAMANWAMDAVYKTTNQTEHQYASCFTEKPDLPLQDMSTGHCKEPRLSSAGRNYGAYLYFQYLAKLHSEGLAAQVLSAMGNFDTGVEALNSVAAFKDEWSGFAKRLWNRAPIDTQPDSFKSWDGLNEQADLTLDSPADLNGSPTGKQELDASIPNLSNRYYRFTFSDPNTRSFLFYNGFYDQFNAGKAIKVLALWKDTAGTWQEEDWSKYKFIGLCRDLKNQRAVELAIIVSNGEHAPANGNIDAGKSPYIKASNLGCFKYSGTARATYQATGVNISGTRQEIESQLSFELDSGRQSLTYSPSPEMLRILSGQLTITGQSYVASVNYNAGPCMHRMAAATFPIAVLGSALTSTISTNIFLSDLEITGSPIQAYIDKPRAYSGIAALFPQPTLSVTVTGANCGASPVNIPLFPFLKVEEAPFQNSPVAAGTGALVGNYTEPFAVDPGTFSWSLTPQSEP